MKNLIKTAAFVIVCSASACTEQITFQDEPSPAIPKVEFAVAKYLWDGPEYKLRLEVDIADNEALESVQILNGEWQIDKLLSASGNWFTIDETFVVSKDANPTKHEVELVVKNSLGGVLRSKIEVRDLSATNQIADYTPDLIPPTILVTSPTVRSFYGIDPSPIPVNIEATITEDVALSSLYMKIWGETVTGDYFELDESWTPATETEKLSYTYRKQLELPGGNVAEYQFMLRATDESGNQAVMGGNLTVGIMDRLYLSDAKNAFEISNQGFDIYANVSSVPGWGQLGTLLPMRRVGVNRFVLDAYYYRNDADENIRFYPFMGTDRPISGTYVNTGAGRVVNYTMEGPNVLGLSQSESGKLTGVLAEASFKLPVTQKGYYTINIDLTERTIEAVPLTPNNPDFINATFFPGYSVSNPYEYFAIVAGGAVAGTSGWTEVDNNTKIYREEEHGFLYSGDFETIGGVNISFTAPRDVLGGQNIGWFRLPAARNAMTDTYGDWISHVAPVGASGNGANYGISLLANKKWYATYDLITYRLRIVETP